MSKINSLNSLILGFIILAEAIILLGPNSFLYKLLIMNLILLIFIDMELSYRIIARIKKRGNAHGHISKKKL